MLSQNHMPIPESKTRQTDQFSRKPSPVAHEVGLATAQCARNYPIKGKLTALVLGTLFPECGFKHYSMSSRMLTCV